MARMACLMLAMEFSILGEEGALCHPGVPKISCPSLKHLSHTSSSIELLIALSLGNEHAKRPTYSSISQDVVTFQRNPLQANELMNL